MKYAIEILLFVGMISIVLNVYASSPAGPYYYNHGTYYVVNSSNSSLNTGTAVCQAVGLQCVGYTDLNTNVCSQVNPTASNYSTESGSSAGFYCNGPSQPGECSTHYNTCEVCSACNVNADCNSTIGGAGDNFQQMFVQCAANATAARQNLTNPTTTVALTQAINNYNQHPSLFSGILSFFTSIFSGFTSFFSSIFSGHSTTTTSNQTTNSTALIGPYPGYWGCTFFQYPWPKVNQNKVSCNDYKAADSFCAVTLESPYATAAYCNQTSGLIVCINPCNKGGQVIPAGCPYDVARPNGAQSPPVNWCS